MVVADRVGGLQTFNVAGLGATLGPNDFVLHFFAVFELFVALHLNGGEVHEYVRQTFAFDEAVTLGCVELLDFTAWHPSHS